MFFKFNNCCDGIFNTVDIRFTKKCDNKCSFCIEQYSKILASNTNVSEIYKSILSTKTDEILILGGEPFLEIHKLKFLIELLRKHNIKIYITTSLPKEIYDNWNYFVYIMDNIAGLNVSIQHWDYIKNNEILHATSTHNRLELLHFITNKYSNKVRACINLVKGSIDSKENLFYAINKIKELNVINFKINELCHSDSFVSFEKIMNIKMKSPYAHGCYTKVLQEEFPNLNIELKRSCFITEKSLQANFNDLFKVMLKKSFIKSIQNKFCVIYENGKIYKNWITK